MFLTYSQLLRWIKKTTQLLICIFSRASEKSICGLSIAIFVPIAGCVSSVDDIETDRDSGVMDLKNPKELAILQLSEQKISDY